MRIGFSFSPGGLLFPYHIGVLSSLSDRGLILPSTNIAGSSAGAIAVASHAVGIDPKESLEAAIRISDKCEQMGGARGRLIPLLEEELDAILPQDAHEIFNSRAAGLAWKEIFPRSKNVLATSFTNREDLIEGICNSSVFPFFSTNWPCMVRWDSLPEETLNDDEMPDSDENLANGAEKRSGRSRQKRKGPIPRVVVDGYFTVPKNRFGCPILPGVERTITVSVMPHDIIGLTASETQDRISPAICDKDPQEQIKLLVKMATSPSPAEELRAIFESGKRDADKWAEEEMARSKNDVLLGSLN